ncbi:hypothetical protein Dda_7133 [Drechslerella dactyloides]|uniref:NACHT-NTPase and P-loop NTPases N-terminal domain-containing protein n=1 Tax=Drechslerella dactyloides TaxID=74499 RepID=A0AAD6IUE0_DREDA|nr:hypothetical protein Dda_7133 [Drechslerella dactyloides]
MDTLSMIASTIAIIQAISKTLRNAKSRLGQGPDPTNEEDAIILAIIKPCQEKAEKLKETFEKLRDKCESEGNPAL